MPVAFENFTHSFDLNGKPVFAPSDLGRRIGDDVKARVEEAHAFPEFYYHLRKGGHVAALHAHRHNPYFASLDIERFFYSISRNRVVRCLREVNVERPGHYGKWSCVRNPFCDPRYSLPYGFIQSPILASLCLDLSEAGQWLRALQDDITVCVYMDDISLSATDLEALKAVYRDLREILTAAGFAINGRKDQPPAERIGLFNCDLAQGETSVSDERRATFRDQPHTPESELGFERYCATVERGNG